MSYTCLICSENNTLTAKSNKVVWDSKAMTKTVSVKYNDLDIHCWYFTKSKAKYVNKLATRVMGYDVIGKAILICPDADLSEDVLAPKVISKWLGIAKALPKVWKKESKLDPEPEPEPKYRNRDYDYDYDYRNSSPADDELIEVDEEDYDDEVRVEIRHGEW